MLSNKGNAKIRDKAKTCQHPLVLAILASPIRNPENRLDFDIRDASRWPYKGTT
jgi:hypothetical protein